MADVCARGALANLKELLLWGNTIGDAGMTAFAGAIGASEAMASLRELYLGGNQIGDAGVEALAKAAADGAMPQLENLNLRENQIGDTGSPAARPSQRCVPQGPWRNLATYILTRTPSLTMPSSPCN